MRPRIGYVIKTERKRHGWTQDQLAEMLNYDRRTISDWENEIGHKHPSYETLCYMAKLFHIPLMSFFEPEDDDY